MKEPIDAATHRNLLDDRDSWRRVAERLEAVNAALTAKLVRIYSFLGPEDVRLPDGRVMRFNNPTIEREMLRELSAAIREIPDAAMLAGKDKP